MVNASFRSETEENVEEFKWQLVVKVGVRRPPRAIREECLNNNNNKFVKLVTAWFSEIAI